MRSCSVPPPSRFSRLPGGLRLGCVLLTMGAAAHAHPIYMEYVDHRAQMTVGATNIDVSVELRFNEVQSLSERRRMDVDRDGIISPAEQAGYLRRIGHSLADAFTLSWAGRRLPLIQLYDPEMDLQGVTGVSPNHHVLKLSYFARAPWGRRGGHASDDAGGLRAVDSDGDTVLVFEDRAWPNAPPLWLFAAGGQDGIDVTTLAADQPGSQPAATRPAVLTGRCRIAGIAKTGVSSQPAAASDMGGVWPHPESQPAGSRSPTAAPPAAAAAVRAARSTGAVVVAVMMFIVLLAARKLTRARRGPSLNPKEL